MRTNRLVQVVCLLLAVACIVVASLWAVPSVQQQRQDLQLVGARSGQDVPASIGFASTMLGPLRPMMVNALWYRVEQLKQEGKFFEINELSRMITTLQPHFADVWAFHAWNMAYNVSVQTYTQAERWDWVNKGIRLLREEGIPINPRSVKLYRELSWIFFHKLGQRSDDAHLYYKTRLARDWQELLGDYATGNDWPAIRDYFLAIAAAPDTVAALSERNPRVRELLDEVILPAGYAIESGPRDTVLEHREKLLREFGKLLIFNYTPRLDDLLGEIRPQPEFYDSALVPLVNDVRNREAIGELLLFLRKSVLSQVYNMQPTLMAEATERFRAPLDFRHPSVHSMYWSYLGVEQMIALRGTAQEKVDRINTLRRWIHSAQDLFDHGLTSYDPINDRIASAPDIRYAAVYERTVELAMAELEAAESGQKKPYRTGYENFLLKAFFWAYISGDEQKAQEYYERAKSEFAQEAHNVESGRYLQTREELLKEIGKELRDLFEQSVAVHTFLAQRALYHLSMGDRKSFDQYMKLGEQFWADYEKSRVQGGGISDEDRMGAPWNVVEGAFRTMLLQPAPIERRSKLWRTAPSRLRAAVWEQVRARLKADAERAGLNFQSAFPPPAGAATD